MIFEEAMDIIELLEREADMCAQAAMSLNIRMGLATALADKEEASHHAALQQSAAISITQCTIKLSILLRTKYDVVILPRGKRPTKEQKEGANDPTLFD